MFAKIAAAKKLQRQQHLQASVAMHTERKSDVQNLINRAYGDRFQSLTIDDLSDDKMRFIRILLSEAKYQCVSLLLDRIVFDNYVQYCKTCYIEKYGPISPDIKIPTKVTDIYSFEFQQLKKLYGFSDDNLGDLNYLLGNRLYGNTRNPVDTFKILIAHPAFKPNYLPPDEYQYGIKEFIPILLDSFPAMAPDVRFSPYDMSLKELEKLLERGCSAQHALDIIFPEPQDLEHFPAYFKLCLKFGARFTTKFYKAVVHAIEHYVDVYIDYDEDIVMGNNIATMIATLVDHGCNFFLNDDDGISYIKELENIEYLDPKWLQPCYEMSTTWSYSDRRFESPE